MKPKRVLIFSLTYIPFASGAELAVKEVTDRIPVNDIVFDLITLRVDASLSKKERVGNVTVHRIGPAVQGFTLEKVLHFPWYLIKVFYVPLAVFKARTLARRGHYDAYWSIMTNMAFPVALLKLFFRDRTPHIITLQDGDTIGHIIGRARIRPFVWLLTRAFKSASVVHAISQFLGRFAKQLGYSRDAVVIPNGVNYEYFSNKQWKRDPLKLVYRFDKKPNDIYLITTSRLVDKNGIDDVIRALHILPERVKFLVVGDGSKRRSLEDLAEELGVAHRTFFAGAVSYEDIPAYLGVSDVFIRPSLSEGMGSSFIEAMAAGLPVIGTPVGGIVDFLFDPDTDLGSIVPTGLFCKPRDPLSIGTAVRRLIDEPQLAAQLADGARGMVKDVYDWDIVAHQMRGQVFDPILK